MNSTSLILGPLGEPLTVEEARTRLRMPSEEPDADILRMIAEARSYFETHDDRKLMTQTWKLKLDRFPRGLIEIPHRPVQSISSVKYFDSNGDLQTVDEDLYEIDRDSFLTRIRPVYGQSWPVAGEQFGAVEIEYIAGYGGVAGDDYILTLTPSWETGHTVVTKTPEGFTVNFTAPAPEYATLAYSAAAGGPTTREVTASDEIDVAEGAESVAVVYDEPLFVQGSAGGIPHYLKNALLLHVGHIYENREDTIVGVQVHSIPRGYDALVGVDRRLHV